MSLIAALERQSSVPVTAPPTNVTAEQLELVKRTIANGATPAELQLFMYDCQRQGVHPLDRLLHFTKRGGKYTPVTSIDLMRIRAADTGEYAGSDDAEFDTEIVSDAVPELPYSARVTVWRLVQNQRCAFTATARWAEYYPGDQGGHMWRKMPRTMLAKCAEALALRKGFPRQLAGLYAAEEMDQADKGGRATTTETVRAEPAGEVVDVETGETKPAAPKGYHYVTGYSYHNGWHEFSLLNYDAQGGSIKLSTKKQIGFIAEQAQADGVPVRVKTTPKRNAGPSEAYLDAIEKLVLPDSLKPFAKEPDPPAPGTCAVCGLAFAECQCDRAADIPF